ncbi:MAG: SMC-Scp complex subunit ScpB, partial [Pseudomonadota bacterium]|jgi:segregation and condensation protein B
MNTEYTRKVLEAGLMAAGRTLSLAELAQLFDEVDRPTNEQLREALAELAESWADRAVELKETAAGFRVQVRREFAEQVSRLWPERPPRYSRALLETLAIIAYRQPITRGEIEAVRGVAVNPNIIRTLFERNWIRVVGHREVPGRPELLGTTRDFLDYFGLKTLDQLPPLAEIKSLEELDPQLALPEPVGVALPAPSADVGESADGEAGEAAGDETADAAAGDEDASGEGSAEGEPGSAAAGGAGQDAAAGSEPQAPSAEGAEPGSGPDAGAGTEGEAEEGSPEGDTPAREAAAS